MSYNEEFEKIERCLEKIRLFYTELKSNEHKKDKEFKLYLDIVKDCKQITDFKIRKELLERTRKRYKISDLDTFMRCEKW